MEPESPEAEGSANDRLSKWVDENGEMVERAAKEHTNWARAVAANSKLSEQVAELAKLAMSPVQSDFLSKVRTSFPTVRLDAPESAFADLFKDAVSPAHESMTRAIASSAASSNVVREILADLRTQCGEACCTSAQLG